jgi:hypothetical protein
METLPVNDAGSSFLRQYGRPDRHLVLFSRRHGLPFVGDLLKD